MRLSITSASVGGLLILAIGAGVGYLSARGAPRQPPSNAQARSAQMSGFLPDRVELGAQPWHSKVDFAGDFVNRSSSDAVVSTIRTSCGCTGIDPKAFAGKIVAPGESMRVTGTLEIGSHLGARTREVELMLASGVIHVLTLSYQGFATYSTVPEEIEFGSVDLDATDDVATSQVRFESAGARVRSAVADVPWLLVAPSHENQRVDLLLLQIDKSLLPHGKNFARITVQTSDAYQPEFSFAVRAEGTAALRATPGRLILRPNGEGIVRFVDSEGKAAELARIGVDSARFDVSKRQVRGEISIRARSAPKHSQSESVAITVEDDRGHVARVLVSVVNLGS